jgi:rhodanese-related sulfurtransferase
MTMDYAGDVSPDDAMAMLTADKNAVLVDVRTRPEWQFVGLPDLSHVGKEPILLEWQFYPDMEANPTFVETLGSELARRGAPPDTPVLFLCRSGARSRSAAIALASKGRYRCFNVVGGFEGSPDEERHRGRLEGWKAKQLPWAQG